MLTVIIIVSICVIALLFAVIVTRAELRRELSGEDLTRDDDRTRHRRSSAVSESD